MLDFSGDGDTLFCITEHRPGFTRLNMAWKEQVISLTELPIARKERIDASFFPPQTEKQLTEWESLHDVKIPGDLRSFLEQSDGLEVACGQYWAVLPFAKWKVISNPCASPPPWIHFGEGKNHHYLLSLGHSPSIYRHEKLGSDDEFFAGKFDRFLELVFQNEA